MGLTARPPGHGMLAAHAAGPVDVRVIPGADHFYTGLEDQVGRMVADWLDSVLGPAG
jgi:alpha/beta superfamily hydrolase